MITQPENNDKAATTYWKSLKIMMLDLICLFIKKTYTLKLYSGGDAVMNESALEGFTHITSGIKNSSAVNAICKSMSLFHDKN